MKPIPSTFLRERFAKAVKEHRGKRTYRQVEKDLASLGGISPQTVARVESGLPPSIEVFFMLCAWMGRNPCEFGGPDEGKVAKADAPLTWADMIALRDRVARLEAAGEKATEDKE